MKLAVGQFQVSRDWQENASTIVALMQEAEVKAARLLVLPEAVLARDNQNSQWVSVGYRRSASARRTFY